MKPQLLCCCLALIGYAACTKIHDHSVSQYHAETSNLVLADTARVPISDLGKKTYLGYMGGLYPGGVNKASGLYAQDLNKFAMAIVPLDSNGIARPNGKIGFISMGSSTGGKMMRALIDKTSDNPLTNPALLLLNACNGQQSGTVNSIMDINNPYWQVVDQRLKGKSLSYKQVQVVYMENDDSIIQIGFPSRPVRVKEEYQQAMRVLKIKFPNIKLVYFLGRTTTFNTDDNPINTEPCPYYLGWAIKFLVEDQINGVPGTAYKGAAAVSPMVTWGWYQWAYGTEQPRKDGFVWQEENTEDGLHANEAGEDTLSNRFQNFLLTDRFASIWYARH